MAEATDGSSFQPSFCHVLSLETASRGPESSRPIAWISRAEVALRLKSEKPPRRDFPSLRIAWMSSATGPLGHWSPWSKCFIASQQAASFSWANRASCSLGEIMELDSMGAIREHDASEGGERLSRLFGGIERIV